MRIPSQRKVREMQILFRMDSMREYDIQPSLLFSCAKKCKQYLQNMLFHPKSDEASSHVQPQKFDAHLLPPELFYSLRKNLLFILEPSSTQEIELNNWFRETTE